MSKICFTEEEMKKLKENKYVKSITIKSISYTEEFKKLFIEETKKGKGPTRIFVENGFNPYILGSKRIDTFSTRMKHKYRNNESTIDNRGKKATGRPKKTKERVLSKEEEIEQLKHENIILKAENDLLKKMKFLIEQRKLERSQQKKDTK